MDNEMNYMKSRFNGWNGNECVFKKDYKKAIYFYSVAISQFAAEYRYFVNRSFCYDQLNDFQLALEDANRAISLNADWGKCHYRKARALRGLRRLQEAEVCLFKVIQLEGEDCKEAQRELFSIRRQAVIECGVEVKIAYGIANQSANINDAINSIKRDSNDMKKCDEKSNDKQKTKHKKSNKNANKPKNVRQNSLENSKNENNIHTKINSNVSLDSKNRCMSSGDNEKNILKRLGDFLLSSNTIKSDENSKSVESIQNEMTDKKVVQNEANSRTEDKCLKSFSNGSNNGFEFKSRNVFYNRRKASGMDPICDKWEDTRSNANRYHSSRYNHNFVSDSMRKSEPTNPWKFKAIFVSNIITTEHSKQLLKEKMNQFGRITSINLIPETESAVIEYDNPESPRVAMSRLQGVYLHNICINNSKLKIRFRSSVDTKNFPSINCAIDRLNNECYFWRTTGCSYVKGCKGRHILANRGVDLQPWMQSMNNKYRRQHRHRL